MWRWMLAVVALVAASVLAPSALAQESAPAQDKKGQARAKLVEGDRLLKLGEFQQALAAFKDAYDLYPSPKIRYIFGLAYEGMGRNADALEAFDAFLVQATDASPETRERAVTARNTLLGRVGTLRVVADVEGATIVVDGRDMGKPAPAREIRLDPGPHLLLVDRGGGTATFPQRLDVAAGPAVRGGTVLMKHANSCRATVAGALGLLFVLALSCRYSPDFSNTRCGSSEPRCPSGYTCDDSAAPPVCVILAGTATGGHGGTMAGASGGGGGKLTGPA